MLITVYQDTSLMQVRQSQLTLQRLLSLPKDEIQPVMQVG